MANYKDIQDKDLEILLGIEQDVAFDSYLDSEYENEVVLMTGAAGSIGSDLARKIMAYPIKKLILLDSAESSLYNLQQEFYQLGFKNFIAIVADIRNRKRIHEIFDTYKPKFVFHAAAYKHVPLMESFPNEAIDVNIYGTKNIADSSLKYNVKKCILISTDKAVNPTNVMGATKRIAELYLKCLDKNKKTKFITTRFGNVLSSNGSVIPLFKKQILAGGPITVTHKEMKRYFMTISSASQFVLKSASIGNGGEIFVYNMGKPISIYSIAIEMIHLSGLKFPENIDVKIIGLRPGEKMNEELYAESDIVETTSCTNILRLKTKPFKHEITEAKINNLCKNNYKLPKLQVVALLKNIVPEYISNNSKYKLLDT